MSQINFRIGKEDLQIYKEIADSEGKSIAELARKAFHCQMKEKRVDYAFNLLANGKCGFKKTFMLSGLSYHEFMLEWAKRDAKEIIPDKMFDDHIKKALDPSNKIVLEK